MARRNIFKTVEGVQVPDQYCLTMSELEKLMVMANEGGKNGLYDALVTAFQYGFVLGGRFTKKQNDVDLQELLNLGDDSMEALKNDCDRKGLQHSELAQLIGFIVSRYVQENEDVLL